MKNRIILAIAILLLAGTSAYAEDTDCSYQGSFVISQEALLDDGHRVNRHCRYELSNLGEGPGGFYIDLIGQEEKKICIAGLRRYQIYEFLLKETQGIDDREYLIEAVVYDDGHSDVSVYNEKGEKCEKADFSNVYSSKSQVKTGDDTSLFYLFLGTFALLALCLVVKSK